MGSIVSNEFAAKIAEKVRSEGKTVVTTNGSFDILHVGHVKSLELARSHGDVLIVGLNSDSSIKQYKSADRPINQEDDRAKMLAALACVDYVTIFEETDPRRLLNELKPHIHVKSASGFKGIEQDTVESNGGKVVLIDDMAGKSTTEMISKIMRVYGAK
jgi:D-glycero-beta-D-manno-heptose 1-phosphate adenylyltransferase